MVCTKWIREVVELAEFHTLRGISRGQAQARARGGHARYRLLAQYLLELTCCGCQGRVQLTLLLLIRCALRMSCSGRADAGFRRRSKISTGPCGSNIRCYTVHDGPARIARRRSRCHLNAARLSAEVCQVYHI